MYGAAVAALLPAGGPPGPEHATRQTLSKLAKDAASSGLANARQQD
jgi:hypothetical protein